MPLSELAVLPIALPLSLAGTVSVSSTGDCVAHVLVVAGEIVSFRFPGASDGISGAGAECAPIVRGCLRAFRGRQ
jgi:hypothetical protein